MSPWKNYILNRGGPRNSPRPFRVALEAPSLKSKALFQLLRARPKRECPARHLGSFGTGGHRLCPDPSSPSLVAHPGSPPTSQTYLLLSWYLWRSHPWPSSLTIWTISLGDLLWLRGFLWFWAYHKSSEYWPVYDSGPGHFSVPNSDSLWPTQWLYRLSQKHFCLDMSISQLELMHIWSSSSAPRFCEWCHPTLATQPLLGKASLMSSFPTPVNPDLVSFLNPPWAGPLFSLGTTILSYVSLCFLWCPHSAVHTRVTLSLLKCICDCPYSAYNLLKFPFT